MGPLLLAASIIVMGACRAEVDAPVDAQKEPAPSADAFVTSGLLPIGGSRAEIRAALGEPERITTEVVPNRHVPGVSDTLFALHYPGLVAYLHRPGMEDAGDLLSRVDVTDNRYLRFAAPAIGTTLDDLESILGPPAEIDGEGFSYTCASCEMADVPVKLMIVENRVREIRFNYYVD